MIPQNERGKFESLVLGNARLYGMSPKDYLRKVWYHEEASKVGEYMALVLLDQLLILLPTIKSDVCQGKEQEVVT